MILIVSSLVISACGSYQNVKSAFEKAGYVEETSDKDNEAVFDYIGSEYKELCKIHVYTKDKHRAIILEFNSEDELNKKRNSNKKSDLIFKAIADDASVKGNCVFFSGGSNERKIFNTVN